MRLLILDYEKFLEKSEQLRLINQENFTKEKMRDKFIELLSPYTSKPQEHKPVLPKLNKIS